jgi:hypothetical protein
VSDGSLVGGGVKVEGTFNAGGGSSAIRVVVGSSAWAVGARVGEVSDGVDSIFWRTRTNTTANSKIINPARPMTTYLSVLFMIALPS